MHTIYTYLIKTGGYILKQMFLIFIPFAPKLLPTPLVCLLLVWSKKNYYRGGRAHNMDKFYKKKDKTMITNFIFKSI